MKTIENSWRDLHTKIMNLDEEQIARMIEAELEGLNRRSILIRLHMRQSKLRTNREREAILAASDAVDQARDDSLIETLTK